MRWLLALLAALALAAPAHALTPGQRAAVLSNPCVGIVLSANYAGSGACYNGSPKPFTAIPGYSFTRASQETCTDLSGLITYAANNVPCVNSAGYAAWQAATNLEIRSQGAFSTNWPATSSTATDTQGVAPDGTSTASLFADAVATASHFLLGPNISFANATAYTASLYAKANTAHYVQVIFNGTTFAAASYANVDLTTCTVTISAGVTASATPLGSTGWCRIAISETSTSAASQFGMAIAASNASGAGQNPSYLGTGASVYIWGAQVE